MRSLPLRRWLLVPVLLLSGAAGLGYQIVWAKLFALGLGQEAPAVVAVVSAFFGGLGLGAWCLGSRVQRTARPGRWYAALEFLIGAWGLLSVWLIPAGNELALRLLGLAPSPLWHWTVAFAVPGIVLLPATMALGATLPAMERCAASLAAGGRSIGAVYAANTLGAAAGTMASAFVLLPTLGFRGTLFGLAAVNLLCGSALWCWQRNAPDSPPRVAPALEPLPGRLAVTLFFTGLFGIGFELVGVHVLAQVLENTVFTFAAVLAVYLLGTALGAAAYQWRGGNFFAPETPGWLLGALAAASAAGSWALTRAPALYAAGRARFGDSPAAVALAEMSVAAAVFAPATLCMGATFSHLLHAARTGRGGVGRAAALNTLGGALAGIVFPVLLLPWLGAKATLVLLALGYLLLLSRISRWQWLAVAVPLAIVLALPPRLQLVELPPGGRLLAFHEGTAAAVAVVETADGHRNLRVNNRFQMGGTAAAVAQRRQAHLPLLLHAHPQRALFLGTGTGITLGAAEVWPDLRLDGVELLPEVLAAMPLFAAANAAPYAHPRVRLFAADARRFVRVTPERYDVIVADLFHPARDGAGALYTREHFAAIRVRLQPGGIFCQWLPLHQLDEARLRDIVRTFLDVFPEAHAGLLHFNVDIPVLGLIAGLAPETFSPDGFEQRTAAPELHQALKTAGFGNALQLLGCLVASPTALRDFAGAGALNTDDRPRVLFDAPRFTYRRDSRPADSLLRLLAEARRHPPLAPGRAAGAEEFARQLADFTVARDLYLRGLVAEADGNFSPAVDAYVEAAHTSLYFTAAYARCVTIIQALAVNDRAAAQKLFRRLEAAQPAQPLGRQLLGPLLQ